MFPTEDGKQYEPHRIKLVKKESTTNGDVSMNGTEEEELVEDPEDDEGATWPLKGTVGSL